MFAYMIVHLTFRAPQIVFCAGVYANVYLAVHLLRRQKYLEQKVNLRSVPLTINSEPSLGIKTAFYRERNNRLVSCQPRTKKTHNFPSTVLESNEHGRSLQVFVGLKLLVYDCKPVSKHFNWDITTMQEQGFCTDYLDNFKYPHNGRNFNTFSKLSRENFPILGFSSKVICEQPFFKSDDKSVSFYHQTYFLLGLGGNKRIKSHANTI